MTDTTGVRHILGPAHCIMFDYCKIYDITFQDLRGPSRKRAIAWVRQDCMAEIRRRLNFSTPQIGSLFNRDHTTVLYGIAASEARRNLKALPQ